MAGNYTSHSQTSQCQNRLVEYRCQWKYYSQKNRRLYKNMFPNQTNYCCRSRLKDSWNIPRWDQNLSRNNWFYNYKLSSLNRTHYRSLNLGNSCWARIHCLRCKYWNYCLKVCRNN